VTRNDCSVPHRPVDLANGAIRHEAAFLHHLWAGFTGDKAPAPFAEWAPYVAAMLRPGLIASSSS
jgi:hypothetical protein